MSLKAFSFNSSSTSTGYGDFRKSMSLLDTAGLMSSDIVSVLAHFTSGPNLKKLY